MISSLLMLCASVLMYCAYNLPIFATISLVSVASASTDTTLQQLQRLADEAAATTWDCDRPWPGNVMYLTIYVPPKSTDSTHSRHKWPSFYLPEYHEIFLRGVMMFWPWRRAKTRLVIMIDSEMKGSMEVQEQVLDVIAQGREDFGAAFPNTTVMFNDPVTGVYGNGYSRMQYLGFMADQFTQEEYIVFVDSDCFFHTYVDREDLFENGKAIMPGRFSPRIVGIFYEKTFEALGKEEFICCMSYFPFVIKRAHLAEIREAIRQHLGKATFEEAYAQFAYENPGAQYDVMCTWLYLNKYDEYAWRIKDEFPQWDGFHNPKPAIGHWGDRSIFRPGDIAFTVPYLSDHCTYSVVPINGTLVEGNSNYHHTRRVLEHELITSLCFLETKPPFVYKVGRNASQLTNWVLSRYSTFCPAYLKENPYHDEWLRFQYYDFRAQFNDQKKSLLKAARASRIGHCEHTYILI